MHMSHASRFHKDTTEQKSRENQKVLHQQCPVSGAMCSLISAEMEDTCQVCVFVLMCEFVCMFLWSGSVNSPCGFGSKHSLMTAWAMPEAEVHSPHSECQAGLSSSDDKMMFPPYRCTVA